MPYSTKQGDSLSVTYSVECRRMYIVTNFQKQRKPSSCFLQSVKIICTLVVCTVFVCVIWSGTKGSSDFFLLFARRLTLHSDKYLDFCPVSNLNAQINLVERQDICHGGKYAKLLFCCKQN